MAVNKVVFGGETVIDLTKDTVTPETLAEGVTAHDKSGKAIVGTMQAGGGDTGGASAVDDFVQNGVSGAYRNDTSEYVRQYAFASCSEMTSADFTVLAGMDYGTFLSCTELKTVIFRSAQGITCYDDPFPETPIEFGTGIILVPQDLLDAYKSGVYGPVWEFYADQLRAIEDFTVDGTVTGEIDWVLVDEELSSVSGSEYIVYLYDPELDETFEVFSVIGEAGMSWYDWVYSDYNTGEFILSDDEMYVMCMGEQYVTTPDGWAITSDWSIDSFDGAIFITHRDRVQGALG